MKLGKYSFFQLQIFNFFIHVGVEEFSYSTSLHY